MGTAAHRSRKQADSHAKYWENPEEGALTYVALGDSAGVGVGVDNPTQGYVGVIAERLQELSDEAIRVENLCVSGAKAHHVLERQIPKLNDVPRPDFVTCVVGGNDVAWTWPFRNDAFSEQMHMIASHLPMNSVMGAAPYFMHWPYERRASKANRAIVDAASSQGHAVADIHMMTKALSIRGYMQTLAGDFFHPNKKGHALWANAIWEQLSPGLPPPQTP